MPVTLDREIKRDLQGLISHPGWELFKDLVMGQRFRTGVDLESAGRAGDGVRCAKFAGQLEMIDKILKLPENTLKKRA